MKKVESMLPDNHEELDRERENERVNLCVEGESSETAQKVGKHEADMISDGEKKKGETWKRFGGRVFETTTTGIGTGVGMGVIGMLIDYGAELAGIKTGGAATVMLTGVGASIPFLSHGWSDKKNNEWKK